MEKRIELEKRGRNPAEIKDLNLDNCRSTSIVGLTDEFVNLENLSLINVGLTSLKGFPKLPNLRKLELSDNRISNGLNLLSNSVKLTHLNLSGNKIKDIEALQPLKEFKHLKSLDLFNNEATSIDNYREKIFNLIPSLKCLDGYDTNDEEVDDSECEEDEVNGNENDSEENENENEEEGKTPLPLLMYTVYGLVFHLGRLFLSTDDEEEFDEEIGLHAVYKEDLEDMSDEGDYEGEEGEEDEDDAVIEEEEDGEAEAEEDEDGEAEPTVRGKKRKIEDGDGN